jgi:hypothetical protein
LWHLKILNSVAEQALLYAGKHAELKTINMMLRIIQFLTILLTAYFFGAAIQQNWLSPWMQDLSAPAFAEAVKSHMQYANLRMPVLVTVFELLIVMLLVLQSHDWRKISYMLLVFAFISVACISLLNTQMSMSLGKEIFAWNTASMPANWALVRNEWLSYQFMNGLFMTGVSVLLFVSIFISWLPQKREEELLPETYSEAPQPSSPVMLETSIA